MQFSGFKFMKKGFTLIEIVVAVSLMTAMSGVLMAQYTQYNRSQSVNMATDRIAQVMAEARVNALSGKKDCYVCGGAQYDCNNSNDDTLLSGWRVSINPTPGPGNVPPGITNGYRIEGICGTNSFFVRDQQFPNNVIISASGVAKAVTFLPVNEGTDLVYPNLLYVDVDSTNGSNSDGFMVSEKGEVTIQVPTPTNTPIPSPSVTPTRTPTPTPVTCTGLGGKCVPTTNWCYPNTGVPGGVCSSGNRCVLATAECGTYTCHSATTTCVNYLNPSTDSYECTGTYYNPYPAGGTCPTNWLCCSRI